MPSGRKGRPTSVPSIRSPSGFDDPINLSLEDIKSLSITNPDDIDDILLPRAAWNGGALGVFCLSLTPDNERILNASMLLQGSLLEAKTLNVTSLWANTEDVSLSITLDDLTFLSFPPGSLVSDYLPSTEFERTFTKSGIVLDPNQLTDAGVSEFCIRGHVYPSTDTFAKIVLTIYPMNITDLMKNPLHSDHRFPGMSIETLEFQLGPTPMLSPLAKPWGFPIVPCIMPGSPFNIAPSFPSGDEIRRALASLLRTATIPDVKKTLNSFNLKIAQILEDGSSISAAKLPGIRWPKPVVTAVGITPASTATPSAVNPEGWCFIVFFFLHLYLISLLGSLLLKKCNWF